MEEFLNEILLIIRSSKNNKEKYNELTQYHLAKILGKEKLSDIIAYLEDSEDFLDLLKDEDAADVIELMDADDAVDVLEDLDSEDREKIIELLSEDAKEDVKLILSFNLIFYNTQKFP